MQHRDVIALWPNLAVFSKDVSEKYVTARAWKLRNSIPAAKWVTVVMAAAKHGYPVSYETLALGAESQEAAAPAETHRERSADEAAA